MKECDLEQLEIELETLKSYLMCFLMYASMALIAIVWSVDPDIQIESLTGFYLMEAVVMIILSAILLKDGLKSRHRIMVVVVLGLQLLALLITAFGGVDGSAAFGPDAQLFIIAALLDCFGVVTTMSSIDRVMRRCHAAD